MTAEQLVVLALLVAAFAAGWIARGGRDEELADEDEGAQTAEVPAAPPDAARAAPLPEEGAAAPPPPPRAPSARPDRVADAVKALSLAASAYETAVDRWLDERDAITPAGRAAVGELERAVQRLDGATARLDEVDETLGDAAFDALEALRDAVGHLRAFRDGRALDAATSRDLDRIEEQVAQARAALA